MRTVLKGMEMIAIEGKTDGRLMNGSDGLHALYCFKRCQLVG